MVAIERISSEVVGSLTTTRTSVASQIPVIRHGDRVQPSPAKQVSPASQSPKIPTSAQRMGGLGFLAGDRLPDEALARVEPGQEPRLTGAVRVHDEDTSLRAGRDRIRVPSGDHASGVTTSSDSDVSARSPPPAAETTCTLDLYRGSLS